MSKPLLLGHRGARAARHLPENTLESFALCLLHGCDGFEFDVRRSSDGAAVICHDPAVAGHEIADTPAAALKLPLLSEVLEHFSQQAFLDIELKVAGVESELLSTLGALPPQKGYVVSSFLPEALRAIHALDPGIPLGFLYERQEQVAPDVPLSWLIPSFNVVTRDLVESVHASGTKLMTWTVNGTEDMRRFAGWGIDAIISDDTELLVRTFR
jgi:glycerophosphoryl diester phosphodiesterase